MIVLGALVGRLALILAVMATVAVATSPVATSRAAERAARVAHLSQSTCEDCHVVRDLRDVSVARKLVASQELLCGRCHTATIKVSHPSGFVPRRNMGQSVALDWKGELTCSTCHAVHGTMPGLVRGDKRGRRLCMACHDNKFFDAMPDKGDSLVRSGHLNAGVELPSGRLDPYSLQCLTCHDAKGESPAVTLDLRGVLRHDSEGGNHPIGMLYSIAQRSGGYRSVELVSVNVLLPDGRVGCVSCHQGFSREHGKLTAPKSGSKLCFQCHDV